jgi:hypothetical protein
MRTLQHQLQDIADWIAGLELDPKPTAADFADGPLRAAWYAITNIPWNDQPRLYRDFCLSAMRPAMAGYPNGPQLYDRVQRVIPYTDDRPFRSLAEIAPDLQPVQWLWPNWLPLGMITLLAAKPGAGKSLIALDLAHRIISGQSWPDGSPGPAAGRNVIYIDSENIPQVHNERAVAWGLPREHLYMLLPGEEDILVDLSSYRHQEILAQMVYRLEPALVIVDSLGAVMGKGENAVEDVRALLGFLAGLAQHHSTGILLIHHLRKSTGGQLPLFESIDPDQIRGSGHITAMSRVAWGLTTVQTGPKPDKNGPRKLEVIKSNLARLPDPLGITLEPLPDGDHVRVVYDADAPEPYREPTERDSAAEWLLEYLETAGKPVSPKEVIAAAQEAGHGRATIYRVRESLKDEIVNTSGRRAPGNCWKLASSELTEHGN